MRRNPKAHALQKSPPTIVFEEDEEDLFQRPATGSATGRTGEAGSSSRHKAEASSSLRKGEPRAAPAQTLSQFSFGKPTVYTQTLPRGMTAQVWGWSTLDFWSKSSNKVNEEEAHQEEEKEMMEEEVAE